MAAVECVRQILCSFRLNAKKENQKRNGPCASGQTSAGRQTEALTTEQDGPAGVSLVAQYAPAPAAPMSPATDDMLTMAPAPPCLSICGISYFMQSQVPLRLILMTESHSCSDCSVSGTQRPSIPALLKAMSSRSNFSTVFWTRD